MHKGTPAVGTVEGTGAAINISLGFKPSYVQVWNEDGLCTLEWSSTMGAGKGVKRVTAGTMTFIGSNGITQYDGSAGADAAGFTIGADGDVNVSAETLHYYAIGIE